MNSVYKQEFNQLEIFKGLNPDQLTALDPILELCHFAPDQVIFKQGQHTDYLYVLIEGKVEVLFKPYDGPPLTVAKIEKGGVFGWSTALGREAYTSSAHAREECVAYRISGSCLQNLCSEYPNTGSILLDRLASVIAERLNTTHTQILSILTNGIDTDCDQEGDNAR